MTWLTALVACPAPTGPMWVIVRPIAARIGLARSTSASVPPTMIVRVPCSAPSEPPETGASTKPTPPAASRAAKPSLAPGLMVEQSTIRLPARTPAARPPGPKSTASTSGVSERQTTTTSTAAASSAGVAASLAPSSTTAAARPGVRFQTVSGKPARARLAAMAAPIVPMPAKPTRSMRSSCPSPCPRPWYVESPAIRRGSRGSRGEEGLAAAEEPQHHQEEVDEVEVERQRADHRCRVAILDAAEAAVLHALDVEGGEAGEEDDAHDADGEVDRRAGQEHVDEHHDQQADDAHEHEAAELREVALRDDPVESGRAEDRGRAEEGGGDAGPALGRGVEGDDDPEGQAVADDGDCAVDADAGQGLVRHRRRAVAVDRFLFVHLVQGLPCGRPAPVETA